MATLVSITLLVLNELTDALLFLPPYLWVLIVFSSGIIGAVIALQFPSLKRWIIGKKLLKARVEDQAQNMFYQHRVSFTEQRTGILLYISFFEKRAVILPDIGIAEVVKEEEWAHIINDLATALKNGNVIEGISAAIAACGDLIVNSHIQVADEDQNELSDEISFNE